MTDAHDDAGFSLIEVLVAIVLFAILSVGFYQVMIAQARVADTTRSVSKIADEARLGFNRMIREVREADSISFVSLDGNQFTIRVNYNGDGYYQVPNGNGDNEVLTFTYSPTAETVTMCAALDAASCTSAVTEVLMEGVDQIGATPVFQFFGNNLEWDWSIPQDGVVTWEELDDADSSHGVVDVGDNSNTLNDAEYPYLSTVKFAMQVEDGTRVTPFHANVMMRNKT